MTHILYVKYPYSCNDRLHSLFPEVIELVRHITSACCGLARLAESVGIDYFLVGGRMLAANQPAVIHPRSGNFKCILVYTVVFVCILNVDNIQLKGWRHVQNGNIEAR